MLAAPTRPQARGRELALEQLHRQEQQAFGRRAEVVDAHRVRMHERAHRLGFALEARDHVAAAGSAGA